MKHREQESLVWDLNMDVQMEDRTYRPYKDLNLYENVLEMGRRPRLKNQRNHRRRKLSREYHDTRHYDYVSAQTVASNEPISLTGEDVLDATITYDDPKYNGYHGKIIARLHGHTSAEYILEGISSPRSNRRETSRLTNEYPISGVQQLESQLKEAQNLFRATVRRTELLYNSLLETQAELACIHVQRDSYENHVHDLQGELTRKEAQLEEVETRNYTLTKDYEALERDNACLRRHLDESSKTLQDTLSEKDRRDLHHIRRRILVNKAIEALKRRYCGLCPMRPNESFYSWSRRVGYPGWERIADMVMDAKYHGNISAHRATQAEMFQTVRLALEDDLESGDTGEGEVLRDMYNFVYCGGRG